MALLTRPRPVSPAPSRTLAQSVRLRIAARLAHARAHQSQVSGSRSTFEPAKKSPVNLTGQSAPVPETPAPAAPAVPTTPEGGRIVNQKLYDYLQANPQVRTVQDLVNQEYRAGRGWTGVTNVCKDLGLDVNEVTKYRSAALMNWAALPPPSTGTAPATVAEANQAFITQYQNDTYNPTSPNSWSNNCGPTSLAMVLRTNGKMPEGLTPEQQIDHARALMYPSLAKTDGRDVVTATGETVRVLDLDKMLTGIDAATRGAQGGGLENATHGKGWDAFDTALNAGDSLVVEGNISGTWRKVFSDHAADAPGSYQSGGNGHFIAVLGKDANGNYLVADPMFTGGAVAMTRDELAVFFAKQGGEPSFVDP